MINIMKFCKTSMKRLEYQRKYRLAQKAKITWEKINLTRMEWETLSKQERDKLYTNQRIKK